MIYDCILSLSDNNANLNLIWFDLVWFKYYLVLNAMQIMIYLCENKQAYLMAISSKSMLKLI